MSRYQVNLDCTVAIVAAEKSSVFVSFHWDIQLLVAFIICFTEIIGFAIAVIV